MIKTRPMEHQALAVEFCTEKNEFPYTGIFADYGTGKTLIALMVVEVLKRIKEGSFKKILVVAPSLAIETTWCDEIRKHSDFRFCLLKGTAKAKTNLLEYAIGLIDRPDRYGYNSQSDKPMLFLINYEGVKSIYGELVSAEFDAVFADESTKIKTFDAERTLALYEVSENIPHRFLMTGFPITENLIELYSQIKFLDRGRVFGNSYYAFINRYFVRMGQKLIVKKRSIKQILDLIKPFCIRITGVLKLPPAMYKPLRIEMTEQQRELTEQLNDTFRLELGKVKIDTQYIFTLLSKSLQICDGFIQHVEYEKREVNGKLINTGKVLSSELEIIDTDKDEALIETIQEIDVTHNKVVIWCAFLFSVSKLERIFRKLRIPVLTLTGATTDVNKVVQVFQKSREFNVLICTQKKAAESVTLTSARYAIYYSNIWSNDARLNSEARIRRKGSEMHKSIMYIDLITKDSVEENVYQCLRKKKDLIDELKMAFLEMKR
jgi:SNF2 family DNA or RNA helicase